MSHDATVRVDGHTLQPFDANWAMGAEPLQAEHFLHEFGEKATDLDEMSANLRKNPEDTLQFGKMMKR